MCMNPRSTPGSSVRIVRWYIPKQNAPSESEEHIDHCTVDFDSRTLPPGSWGQIENSVGEVLMYFGEEDLDCPIVN